MKYKRRFIILFSFILAFLGCRDQEIHQMESPNFELIELGKGIYGCIHKFGGKAICNVGIVDNGNETIIFDSFLSPAVAKELLGIIKEMGLSPIKYVINSHSHNDHIRGNQVFSNDIKIISTRRTAELIEEREPLEIIDEKNYAPGRFSYYDSLYNSFNGDKSSREYQQILMWRPYYEVLANSHLEIKTRLPDLYLDSIQHLNGPNRKIQLITKGQGHTDSDLVMYLPDDRILFSGDLIFNMCHPYVPNGSISKWKDWLDFMDSLNPLTIVPGHGAIGGKDLIVTMKYYLSNLEIKAKDLHATGEKLEDIDRIRIPEEYRKWWFEPFYTLNLKFAFEEVQAVE